MCHRTVEREGRLGPAVSGRDARVALHARLCPQRRPRTRHRKVSVGVRGIAAEEEKADAHHCSALKRGVLALEEHLVKRIAAHEQDP